MFSINGILLDFEIHIIEDDLPILLSLADMDRLGIYFNNLTNRLVHHHSKQFTIVKRLFGHPFIQWDPLQQAVFRYTELKRLHKRFGHPHGDKLYNLLKRADLCNFDSETHATLEDNTRKYKPSQTYAQAPRRFKFALRENKDFNNMVFVEIF